MNENNDLKFNTLFDSAFNLLQSIDNTKKYSDDLLKDISDENTNFHQNNITFRQCNNSFQRLIKEADNKIINSINNRSHNIAQNIVNSINEDFTEANHYANEASNIYQQASDKIIYKVFSLSFITFLVLSIFMYFGYTYFLEEKVNNLHQKVELLEKNKFALETIDYRFDEDNNMYVRVDVQSKPKHAKGESIAEFMAIKVVK